MWVMTYLMLTLIMTMAIVVMMMAMSRLVVMMVASHLSFKIKGGAPLGGNLFFQSIRPGEQVLKRRRIFLIILRLLDYDQG